MNRHYLPVTLLAALLATLGCGDDGDDGSSGAAGSGGSGGAGGEAGVGGTGGGTVEPAKMVHLPAGFWIDSTEVTRAQYAAWIETNPSTSDQLPECQWNDSYTIPANYPVEDRHDHPVAGVDWCDAYAYCKGVGKRLCGKIGGGPTGVDDHYDATISQWYYACSSGGLYEYPYGNEYDANACNLKDTGLKDSAPVGSYAACHSSESGFEGVFDLAGNLAEWVDACGGATGPEDGCVNHGSSAWSSDFTGRCRIAATWGRNLLTELVGFRCCRD